MKQRKLLNLITGIAITLITNTAQAALVPIFATEVLDSSHDFEVVRNLLDPNTGNVRETIDDAELSSTVTSDADTFVIGTGATSFIRLGFGSKQVVTGEGDDIAIFTIGNGYSFGLNVYDNSSTPQLLSSLNYSVTPNDQAVDNGNGLFLLNNNGVAIDNISVKAINLLGSANGQLFELNNGIEIGYIDLFIGSNYNDTGTANFSLAGAFYSSASTTSAVPLPLPVILFSSGLALLGLAGRRKRI